MATPKLTVEQVEEAVGPLEQWASNCHGAPLALVRSGLLPKARRLRLTSTTEDGGAEGSLHWKRAIRQQRYADYGFWGGAPTPTGVLVAQPQERATA